MLRVLPIMLLRFITRATRARLRFFCLCGGLMGAFYAPAGEEAPTPPPASRPDGNVCVRSAEKYLLGFPADIILR